MTTRAIVRLLHASCVGFLVLSAPAPVPADDQSEAPVFFHWSVKSPKDKMSAGMPNYAEMVDIGDGSLARGGAVILYASEAGLFPHAGPHVTKLDPEYMDNHVKNLEMNLDKFLPDENYSGLVVIDYEDWNLTWERTWNFESDEDLYADDRDYRDDWKEYLGMTMPELLDGKSPEEQEAVLKATYEQAAKEFYLTTIQRCQELRPKAKFGFYNYPNRKYHTKETPKAVIGYGDLTHEASAVNDELEWLWEVSDFIVPNVYQNKITQPEGAPIDPQADENKFSKNVEYVTTNVKEAIRVAQGKPVYPIVWYRYFANPKKGQLLNEINLRHSLELPLEAGADGVIVWDSIESEAQFVEVQNYVDQVMLPMIDDIVDEHLGSSDDDATAGNEDGGSDDGDTPIASVSSVLTFSGAPAPSPPRNDGEVKILHDSRAPVEHPVAGKTGSPDAVPRRTSGRAGERRQVPQRPAQAGSPTASPPPAGGGVTSSPTSTSQLSPDRPRVVIIAARSSRTARTPSTPSADPSFRKVSATELRALASGRSRAITGVRNGPSNTMTFRRSSITRSSPTKDPDSGQGSGSR